MKYIVYMRVSTDKQEESGLGLEAQRHTCLEWINTQKTKGFIVEFIEIITGTDKKRKDVQDRYVLMEAIDALDPGDVFVIAKRDRLSRDTYLNCMIERLIERKQATLYCAGGEANGDDPHNILMRRIIDAFAEYEAMIISVRTKAALARKKAKGERLGHVPYGYMLDDQKNMIVCNSEYLVLSEIHKMKLQGYNTRDIASELNLLGLRNRPNKNRSEITWTHGAVNRVYKNYKTVKKQLRAIG